MKQLSEPQPSSPPPITKSLLTEWARKDEKRRKLMREAKQLGDRQAEIEEQVFLTVKAEGGEVRRIDRFGYELAIVTSNGSVQWKKEFVRVAGQAEADRVAKAAPTKESVEIRKL